MRKSLLRSRSNLLRRSMLRPSLIFPLHQYLVIVSNLSQLPPAPLHRGECSRHARTTSIRRRKAPSEPSPVATLAGSAGRSVIIYSIIIARSISSLIIRNAMRNRTPRATAKPVSVFACSVWALEQNGQNGCVYVDLFRLLILVQSP